MASLIDAANALRAALRRLWEVVCFASLRTRLVIATVVLSAGALTVVNVAVHKILDSYLVGQVDHQIEAAFIPVAHSLRDSPGGVPQGQFPTLPPPPPSGRPKGNIPLGTYGELRLPGGGVVSETTLGYPTLALPRPNLPTELPVSKSFSHLEFVTVDLRGRRSGTYRVAALETAVGGSLVVAIPLGETEQTLDRLERIQGFATLATVLALAGLIWWVIGLGPPSS